MPKPKDVIGYAHDKKALMVDLKFMDFLGLWQHFTVPLAELTEGVFEEALGELKKDHEFLLKGDVFTEDVIETWIEHKIEKELNPVRLRPTPTEFALYFDI
jgi:glutamine synthetase